MKTLLFSFIVVGMTTLGGLAFAASPKAAKCCGEACCNHCPTCCTDCCPDACCTDGCCGNCPACCE